MIAPSTLSLAITAETPFRAIVAIQYDVAHATLNIEQRGSRIFVNLPEADATFKRYLGAKGPEIAYLIASSLQSKLPPSFADPVLRGLYEAFAPLVPQPIRYPIDARA